MIFGEHIEWIWINQTWGGIKIGPNQPTFQGGNNSSGVNPLYLGINQNQIKPIKFQFKGDDTLYGCKLPVEGRVFSDLNVKSTSLVDLMKPFQIGYNLTNNQIADILVDELGTVTSPGKFLTHLIFHPIEKSANRKLEIIYTIRITAGV